MDISQESNTKNNIIIIINDKMIFKKTLRVLLCVYHNIITADSIRNDDSEREKQKKGNAIKKMPLNTITATVGRQLARLCSTIAQTKQQHKTIEK